ncbi:hypothetical protein H7200_00010 [Candidatus Saccharibacteria bacterium]|nr:hypothetical protein [Candidatus Saccharibacteria bacterium]
MSGFFSLKIGDQRRAFGLFVTAIVAVSFLAQILISLPALGKTQAAMELDEKAQSTSYYVTLRGCISNHMYGTIKAPTDNLGPTQIDWFDGLSAFGYIFTGGKDGKTEKFDCKQIMSKALVLWGVTGREFLAGIGYVQKSSVSYDRTGPSDGSVRVSGYDAYVKKILDTNEPNNPGGAAAYMRYGAWWNSECVVKKFGPINLITDNVISERISKGFTTIEGDFKIKYGSVARVDGIKYGYSFKTDNVEATRGGKGQTPYTYIAYGYRGDTRTISCEDTAKALTEYADDFSKYIDEKAVRTICEGQGYANFASSSSNPPGSYKLSACINGFTNKDNPTYCTGAYPDGIINFAGSTINVNRQGERDACTYGAGINADTLKAARATILGAETNPEGEAGGTGTSCGIEAIGWIVCPAISFMGDVLQDAFKGLSNNFLVTNPELFNTDSGTYAAWSVFRNFANVAFVIVFLIIIFSQLTSMGVSNYGVKKLLPRIVIAAILVNISFFVCQLAVDVSNILGYSLKGVFDQIATTALVPTSTEATNNGGGIALIVTAVIATAIVSYFALGILIPILLGAVVAVLMIVLLLIARKAIIVLLIVLSPLAFVAFLLPNTETYFTKWRKAFTALLLLFPIISVVFGMSSLAAQILLKAGAPNTEQTILQIIALGVTALPFFIVPTLLKNSLDGIGTVGSKLNGFAAKAGSGFGRAGGKAFGNSRLGQFQKYRSERRATRGALIRSGQYEGDTKNPLNIIRNARSGVNEKINSVSGQFGTQLAASGVSIAAKVESEETAAAEKLYQSQITKGASAETLLASAIKGGNHSSARALQNIMFRDGAGGVDKFYKTVSEGAGGANSGTMDALRENIKTNHGQYIKSKSSDLVKWASVGGSLAAVSGDSKTWEGMSQSDMATQTGGTLKRIAESGAINPKTSQTAADLLANAQINGGLDPEQKAQLSRIANGAVAANKTGGGGSGPSGLFIPGDKNFNTTPSAGQPPKTPNSSGQSGLVLPNDSNFNVPHDDSRK